MKRLWNLVLLIALMTAGALLYLNAKPASYPEADLQTLRVANELYDSGQTAQAIRLYEQLVEQGVENATLFYNLAYAHTATGDHGQALYYYLRAEQLAPRDPDIDTNLQALRTELARVTRPTSLPAQIIAALENTLTLNETGLIALSLWVIAGLCLIGVRHLRPGLIHRLGTLALVVVSVVFLATGGLFATRVYRHLTEPLAVVLADQVAISPTPGLAASNALTLPAGSELRVIGGDDEWLHVTVEGTNSKGWVPAAQVGVVG